MGERCKSNTAFISPQREKKIYIIVLRAYKNRKMCITCVVRIYKNLFFSLSSLSLSSPSLFFFNSNIYDDPLVANVLTMARVSSSSLSRSSHSSFAYRYFSNGRKFIFYSIYLRYLNNNARL